MPVIPVGSPGGRSQLVAAADGIRRQIWDVAPEGIAVNEESVERYGMALLLSLTRPSGGPPYASSR